MKEASLYIRIVECFLLLIVGLCFLYYFFFFEEKEENRVEGFEAVLDASANLQQYYDYSKLLDPVSNNLNPNGIQQRNAQDADRELNLNVINLYCNTRDPENILSSSISQSKDFSVCKKPPIKDAYRPTIIVEGFVDINKASIKKESEINGLVPIRPGATSFEYTVIGGGGAGGGGGARFANQNSKRGGGGGGGGSSGEIIRGSGTIEPNMRIYVNIGNGGRAGIPGSRYTANKFYKRPKRSWEEAYYNFKDGNTPVIFPSSSRELPWRGETTTLTFGNTVVTALGGNGGFVGGNMGMRQDNRDIIRGNGRNLYPENAGFGSAGGEAVPKGVPGQRGQDGNENLGVNKSKGGAGGNLNVFGYGNGGEGGRGGVDPYHDGNYGSAGNIGAVLIEWK